MEDGQCLTGEGSVNRVLQGKGCGRGGIIDTFEKVLDGG